MRLPLQTEPILRSPTPDLFFTPGGVAPSGCSCEDDGQGSCKETTNNCAPGEEAYCSLLNTNGCQCTCG